MESHLDLFFTAQMSKVNVASKSIPVIPFIKWPGGKRWLATEISQLYKESGCKRYIEPFLGGGAVFFNIRPPKAILADLNNDLINTYRAVKRDSEQLAQIISKWPVTKDQYLKRRSWTPRTSLELAARFLYLNRTCFGGMYRVNRRGQFNVPYGNGDRTPNCLWENNLLQNARRALRSARILCCDFEKCLNLAGKSDFVYCDPTYTVAHNNNGFRRYNESVFSWTDQERLAKACQRARKRGAVVIVSNAYHDSILALYDNVTVSKVTRKSLLCPNPAKRHLIEEAVLHMQ